MAINVNALNPRLADRKLFLITAIGFPLLVLIGYFKSYYFSAFFADARPIATNLVHLHAVVMSLWVVYFVAQVFLIRTKNIKLHMTMGMAGIALAAVVVIVGMATAVDSNLIRQSAPPGVNPHAFFILPFSDMAMFALFFAAAIYYRKRPTEHKSLMFLTAINFLPAALFRVPLVPAEYVVLWVFSVPALMAIGALTWHSWKHRKVNLVFAIGTAILVLGIPVRMFAGGTRAWLGFVGWLVS